MAPRYLENLFILCLLKRIASNLLENVTITCTKLLIGPARELCVKVWRSPALDRDSVHHVLCNDIRTFRKSLRIFQNSQALKNLFLKYRVPFNVPLLIPSLDVDPQSQSVLYVNVKVKVNQSHYRSEVPRGFQEVKVPRLHDNGPGWW